jgi:O-succinylbenzoate synthase
LHWSIYRYQQALVLSWEGRWAEIAPLAGRSQETLAEAEGDLLAALRGQAPKCASVQCALAHLLVDELPYPLRMPLCPLFEGTVEEILRRAKRAQEKGFTVAKVKISQLHRKEAQGVLRALQGAFRLRIDCNKAFSVKEICALAEPFDFDYLEDPTYEVDKLSTFPLPFALDEALGWPGERCVAVVLKPTVLGSALLPWMERAREQGWRVIFSSARESSLGLLQIAHLASRLHVTEPLGLDTRQGAQSDLLLTPPDWSAPELRVERPPTIDLTQLTEIAHGDCCRGALCLS